MKNQAPNTFDGTRAQVAAFLGVTLWTMNQWVNHPKPLGPVLFPSRLGNAQRFDEDQVAMLWARRYGRALGPGAAEQLGREKWREFLKEVRASEMADAGAEKVSGGHRPPLQVGWKELEARVARVEAQLGIIHKEAA